MVELEPILAEVYLMPGDMVFARKPMILATTLGSCVGITFYAARLGAGALCHAILPHSPHSHPPHIHDTASYRYVDSCIRNLSHRFAELGAAKDEIEVKVFGGADVLVVPDVRATVGRQNIETAMQVLACEGYAVAASSVGDRFGRKIRFNTASGEVDMLRLASMLTQAAPDICR
jgi:chemotaxis protein CheD